MFPLSHYLFCWEGERETEKERERERSFFYSSVFFFFSSFLK